MKHVVVCVCLGLITGLLYAQEMVDTLNAGETVDTFSIKEAQDYAIEHNKTLMNARQDIELAEQKYKESRGAGLPQVDGSVAYTTNFNYELELDFGIGDMDFDATNTALDAGDFLVLQALSDAFSSGTTIIMGDQLNANVQVSMLLFSGQYWTGLQLAKIAKKLSEQNYQNTELDVKENIINTYYMILVTTEMINIIEENQQNLQSILRHTSDMYHVGVAEQTDVDQIQINLSQLDNSTRSMERNLQLSYNMFRFVMGMDPDQEVILTDSLSALITNLEENLILVDSLDLEQNTTYQLLLSQEEIGKKTVDLKRWAYIPTLAGYYQYTQKIVTTAFDLSPANVAGVTLSVPIFSGGTRRAQVTQAKIELDKVTRNKEMLEQQLRMQSNQLLFELNSAYDNYLTQKQNVEVAKRAFNNVNNKYHQGMVSSLDLTQSNTNYLTAESNYVQSVLQLLQAQLNLDKLYNKL